MATAKVAVTIDSGLLKEVDGWVQRGLYRNRSRALQAGLERLKVEQQRHSSLIAELSKLDPVAERALAEEALAGEVPWPEY